ncbi:Chitinase A1 precursor [Raoultella ornithinolytica]|nr:Chitinase A1 precursor [Raoultella ornithinolytica]
MPASCIRFGCRRKYRLTCRKSDIAPAEPESESPAFRRRLGGSRILRRSGDEGNPGGVIQSAQEIVEKYGLDGIDLDWEYPVNGAWGLVASQPADRDNFTALLKELRAAFGSRKLVTIAVGANAESPKSWVDIKAIAPSLDYINLMTYDMAYGTQYFNANLYDSTRWPTVAAADKYSADFVVNNYLAAGLKPSQMNLGIGFYGRVPKTRP